MQCKRKAVHSVVAAVALATIGLAAQATFPGENGAIVFSSNLPGNGIYRATANGATSITLDGAAPAVSPNGKKIAFRRFVDGQWHILVMNFDGSNVVDLGPGIEPAWLNDGSKIVFINQAPYPGISVMAPMPGSARTLLFSTAAEPQIVSTSPSNGDLLYEVALDTWWFKANTQQHVLVRSGTKRYRQATWAPDGTSMVAVGAEPGGNPAVYRVNLDGSNPQPIAATQLVSGVAWPSISPDGTRVLAQDSSAVFEAPMAGGALAYWGGVSLGDWSRMPRTPVVTTFAGTGWPASVALAGDADTYVSQSDLVMMPGAGLSGDTWQQAVAIGGDGRVLHRSKLNNGTWGPYYVAPRLGSTDGLRAKTVRIAAAYDGSTQMVAVGSDDLVYHAMRYPNGTWSGFAPLDGVGGGSFAARDVAIAIAGSSSTSPGQSQVVANGLEAGQVYHRTRQPNGTWTPWDLPPGSPGRTENVAIATTPDGDAFILATPRGSEIWRQVRYANGNWDGWLPMSNVTGGRVNGLALTVSDNSPDVAWVGYVLADGSVFSSRRPNPISASTWTIPTTPTMVMTNGRSVSITNSGSVGAPPTLVVVQAQPQ